MNRNKFFQKIDDKTISINDQEEALEDSDTAIGFAILKIPGTDLQRCQESACKDPKYAYRFALYIAEADIEYCRKHCESSKEWSKEFTENIGTVYNRISNKTLTLSDQEACLANPEWAWRFASEKIPGTDFKKCQDIVCKEPEFAYKFACLNIPGTDIEKCQEAACKKIMYTYYFARAVKGANIKYCQEAACKDKRAAHRFAEIVPGADIEYCRNSHADDKEWLKEFDKMIAEKALA